MTAIRASRHSEMTAFSMAYWLPERSGHVLRIPLDHGQQDTRRPVWTPGTMLPLLTGACVEAVAVGEFLPAQSKPLAELNDPAGRRVVDHPTGQIDLFTNMRMCLAQRRLAALSRPDDDGSRIILQTGVQKRSDVSCEHSYKLEPEFYFVIRVSRLTVATAALHGPELATADERFPLFRDIEVPPGR